MTCKTMLLAVMSVPALAAVGATDIGSRREVFWDDFLVDAARTTAARVLHQPRYDGVVLEHVEQWEGDGSDFHNIVVDSDERGKLFRMYYLGWACHMLPPGADPYTNSHIRVCYAESRDGVKWTKPVLGLREFNGSTANNIIFSHEDNDWDNFMVFKDTNPACPAAERYKAVARTGKFASKDRVDPKGPSLISFVSGDGIHFTRAHVLLKDGAFDTLNVGFRDELRGDYHLYVRGFHRNDHETLGDFNVRDIRHAVSSDFRAWSVPRQLSFVTPGGAPAEDYPLYTNVVEPYSRAPHLYVGFPTRYVERRGWTPNYDRLPSPDLRRFRMKKGAPRYGLVVTDCVFMMSRDGQTFQRDDDAFMTPGPERRGNWVYGDCYPARGLIETAGVHGDDRELSLFTFDNHWSGPSRLVRHTLRLDGFVSRHGAYDGRVVVTKPFVYAGGKLEVNFSTSARGRMFVTLADGSGRSIRSVEMFGDSVDRTVDFKDGSPAEFAGRPVTLEFLLHDADIYSFRFH